MDLLQEINYQMQQLDIVMKQYRITGTDFAEKERNYKILLSKRALELRDSGMAITLINTVIYGEKDVARARFDRDVAQVTHEANKEAINVYKLKLRILQDQFSKEYVNG
ncbi:MAG TPA: hypothetical protein DHS57_08305 [Erysipelotrichaceae bacterium]|nr:hypothetical protein [Erysipelotrichaceae bacterium]